MYLGNQPALSYTSFAKQDFTTSATTSYTLDQPVANENEIALFINFVRQEPTTAYTASGTTLTLTSATSASDDMYCVFLGKAVQTVNPPSGSVGISQLSATGTPSSSTFLRGDNSWQSAGGTNTPAFSAYGANPALSNNTLTKLVFGTELYDTDSAYDTSNGRFTVPSGEGGKYFFHAKYRIENDSGHLQIEFYKNGSEVVSGINREENGYGTARYISVSASYSDDLSAGDYIEVYGTISVGNTNGIIHPTFFGYKLIT